TSTRKRLFDKHSVVSLGTQPVLVTSNCALTTRDAVMLTEQPAAPAHDPPHPEKIEPGAAVAIRVTPLPGANGSVQTAPQLIPAGMLVTVPTPPPVFKTVRSYTDAAARLKKAATDFAEVMDTLHCAV